MLEVSVVIRHFTKFALDTFFYTESYVFLIIDICTFGIICKFVTNLKFIFRCLVIFEMEVWKFLAVDYPRDMKVAPEEC